MASQEKLKEVVYDCAISPKHALRILTAVQEYSESLAAAKPIVSGALPPDSEVEKWFAGEKVGDAKFWSDAPFRENGDVVGIVIDALKYFMSGNDH